jgi:hypothetical protein
MRGPLFLSRVGRIHDRPDADAPDPYKRQSSIDFFVNQLANLARDSRNNHGEFIVRRGYPSCAKSELDDDCFRIE